MRRSLRVALIASVGGAILWGWTDPDAPQHGMGARLDAVIEISLKEPWVGGFSGLEVTADGQTFHLATDNGHWAQGQFRRDGTRLTGLEIEKSQPFLDKDGLVREFPHNDAEGLALDADGRLYVSFEHAHRILYYNGWEDSAKWPAYTRSWEELPSNKGLELVALGEDGTLYTIPEDISSATEAVVYRRKPYAPWEQPFALPLEPPFAPVGADFGPDGRLYVLERAFGAHGFASRVRAMTVSETGLGPIETVLQTAYRTHGNLEGLAVWRDAEGFMHLTMVSDDNFYAFLPSQIVEYVLETGLAKSTQ